MSGNGDIVAALRVFSVLLLLAMGACRRDGGERTRIPAGPPRSLEILAEEPEPGSKPADEEPRGFGPNPDPIRRDQCGIPLAVSPEGLMKPAGIELIQARLVERGLLEQGAFQPGELDSPTLAAIRSLQEDVQLPTVGLPTYSTVRALGIPPEEAFLMGDPSCGDGT